MPNTRGGMVVSRFIAHPNAQHAIREAAERIYSYRSIIHVPHMWQGRAKPNLATRFLLDGH